jgi:excisionase family DNA binding protein
MMPLLLTPEQARRQLGVSERGLRDLLKNGLPFIKVGKRRLIPANDLVTWISERARCPARHTNSTSVRTRSAGGYRGPSTVIAFEEACARTTRT